MKILFYIELLCLSLCQFSLYLQHIIINNDNEINFDLYTQKIPEKITKKDIFDIIIHSENNEEQNITFKCSLFGKNSINSTSIKCNLKDKIILNDEGPFYISKEHLQKSFGFYYNEKFLYSKSKYSKMCFKTSRFNSLVQCKMLCSISCKN